MILEMLLAAVGAALLSVLLAGVLRGRAPARKNAAWKALAGFFPPLLIVLWSAGVLLTPPGPTRWAAIWLPIGLAALFIAGLLATVASPRKPRKREERQVARSGEPLDPLFVLYSFGVGLAMLAAAVTRGIWA